MPESGFEKAQIKNLETNDLVDCMFKPKELSLSKTNTWSGEQVKEKDVPTLEFGGGGAEVLTMQLFFDTYQTGEDVRKYTNKVWNLMYVTTNKKPPQCQFIWGMFLSFKAYITSINQKFTLFLSDGRPVRSTMDVSFKQATNEKSPPPQNPTTVCKPGYRTRRVMQGETLDWIAFEEYGDANRWRLIADTNKLDDPRSLKEGLVLAIPPLG